MHTFGVSQGQFNLFLTGAYPFDGDFSVGCVMITFRLGQVCDEMRNNVSSMNVISFGVKGNSADILNKPGADTTPEVVIQRIDRLIVAVKILTECGFAPGDPVTLGRIGWIGEDLVGKVRVTKLAQYKENDSRTKHTGIQVVILLMNFVQ